MAMISLVVMEQGSQWPGQVRDSGDVVAVGSGQDGLLQRTRQELDLLRRRGQQVRIAVLACNGVADVGSVAHRAELVDELLTAVSAVAFGRLVLSTADGASMHLRRELLLLAGALSQRLRGTSTTVSVKFGGVVRGTLDLQPRPVRRPPRGRSEASPTAELRASNVTTGAR
jgi:hypothetical protein